MKCYFCNKISVIGGKRKKLRGKYNPTIKKRKYPNLQWVKLTSDPTKFYKGKFWRTGKRVLACTKCIKTLVKQK